MSRGTGSAWATLLLLLGVSCGGNDDSSSAAIGAAGQSPETRAMAQRLLGLSQGKGAGQAAFGKQEKVERLEAQPLPAALPAQVDYHANYGNALIAEGRSVEALVQYRLALEKVLQAPDTLQPGSELKLRRMIAVTHLRIGEQANCQDNHNADSCLLPIQGRGVHLDSTGSEGALEEYLRVLDLEPGLSVPRWLANIAAMTIGRHPDALPEDVRIPSSVFDSDLEFPRFRDVAGPTGVDVFALSGGAALEDFDGDGNLDLITSSWNLADQVRYFRNAGDGGFEERTEAAGLLGITGGLNLTTADYDNDGDVDVLVLRGAWLRRRGRHPNSLLRNRGDGSFDDVTQSSGMLALFPTQVGAWADFDQDGWLDLFVGNESAGRDSSVPWQLFRNLGDGSFEDVAHAVGLAQTAFTKGASWGDYDEDGDLDLYISNIAGANELYENLGAGTDGAWSFRSTGGESGAHAAGSSFATWFWDYDNDGRLDLTACSYPLAVVMVQDHEMTESYLGLPTTHEPSHVFRNLGGGTFAEQGPALGLKTPMYVMGANFGDIDNDGFLDAYFATGAPSYEALMPNRMFRNDGGRRFQDVTTAGGFGHLQKGHAISFGDIDNDGDLDVYAVMGGAYDGDTFPNALFENPGFEHAWVTLRLEGVRSPRTPIGARVALVVEDADGTERTIHRMVSTGGSFGANSLQLEVGLGAATRLARVEIRWPAGGATEILKDLELRKIHAIREGDGSARVVDQPRIQLRRAAVAGHAHHHGD